MDSSLIPSMHNSVWRLQFKCVYSLTKIQSWTTSFFINVILMHCVYESWSGAFFLKSDNIVMNKGTWASEKQMSSFSSSNVWLPAKLDPRLWSGCQKMPEQWDFSSQWTSVRISCPFSTGSLKSHLPSGWVNEWDLWVWCVCVCVSSPELPVIPKFCPRQC